jgi:NAD(P)H dehydrogenase (quinone)
MRSHGRRLELIRRRTNLARNHVMNRLIVVTVLLLSAWCGGTAGLALAQSAQSKPSPSRPITVLIAYHTLRGHTEEMARGVEEGVRRVPGVVPVLKKVEEVTKEDLVAADGIILGCPTYFANIPGSMKTILDTWNWKLKIDFTDKIGGAFTTGGGQMGGKEHTVVSLLLFMINNRMVVAGPLYEDEQGDDKWGELGAGAMTGPIDPKISPAELDSARRVGERIARLAKKMR